METIRTFENYPARLVAIAVLVTVAIYAAGIFIFTGFGGIMTALYLLFCIGNEVRVMKMSCADCYYYGKWCALGRGKLAPLFFKRGDPQRFSKKSISWKELLPDMLVTIFPLVAGIVLLVKNFSWGIVLAMILLLALTFQGNYLVRTRIACAFCKQRELGCPAERFFNKKNPEDGR